MSTDTTYRWTRQRYEKAVVAGVFDGERCELVNGQIIPISPVDAQHATAVTLVQRRLEMAVAAADEVLHVRIQQPIALSECDEPEPDAAIVAGDIRTYAHEHPTKAILLVEVANSSLHYDLNEKASQYAQHGATNRYLVVDLPNRQVIEFTNPVGDEFEAIQEFSPASHVMVLGTSVPVADFLP